MDDLEDIANLDKYIERTQLVLIFCSKGYFQSKNCMIELRATVCQGKPIIPLVEPDSSRGGLTKSTIYQELCEAATKTRMQEPTEQGNMHRRGRGRNSGGRRSR